MMRKSERERERESIELQLLCAVTISTVSTFRLTSELNHSLLNIAPVSGQSKIRQVSKLSSSAVALRLGNSEHARL